MSAFDCLGHQIRLFLSGHGITAPTPIQLQAIPILTASRENALLLAPTGSGKTEAALLPLLNRLHSMAVGQPMFGIFILYVTPLRALNRDVLRRVEELCAQIGVTVEVRHGDTTQYARRKQAIRPPNLLIITPESLQAILPGRRMQSHLKTVFAVVVDEIHELADSKRGVQLSFGIQRLERVVGAPVQRIGLSATVGNPDMVSKLLAGTNNSVQIVWAGFEARQMALRVEMPSPSESHGALSKRLSYPLNSTARLSRIVDLIGTHASTIVFTNTRSFAEVLGSKMKALNPPYEFDVHHGSLSRGIRLEAEERLKSGLSKAIIATSSLELGIDVGQADLVVQYSSPRSVSRALQRTGRAGHKIGGTAEGVLLATVNIDDVTESGVILRRAKLNKVEDATIPEKPWDVLCHQICGLTLDSGAISEDDLYQLIRSVYPFREITHDDLKRLLGFMNERRLIVHRQMRVERTGKTRVFYYEHLSTIPDVRQMTAVDIMSRMSIGVLDEDYVQDNVGSGSSFVIRGRPYTVVSIEEDEILCTPATQIDTDAPRWVGEMIPVPYEVASEVVKVWNQLVSADDSNAETWLLKQYGLDTEGARHVTRTIRESLEVLEALPSEDRVVVEDIGSGLVVHIALGTKGNETLGIIIAALLTTREGFDVGVERDPYRILLTSSSPIDPEHIEEIFTDYDPDQVIGVLHLALKNTQTFASRFIHVARRMGIIRRDAKTSEIPVRKIIHALEDTPVYDEAMKEVLDDKMDEKRVIQQFERHSKGALHIHIARPKSMSPLARLIVEEKSRFEVIGEITEEDEVLRLMERRLLSRRFRLVCTNCGWNSVRTVATLDDEVVCPACSSKMIAVLHPDEKDSLRVVRKRRSGKELTAEEEKKQQAGVLTAQLVAQYGRRALIVLAGRGIGPSTAARVLSPGREDRLLLLRAIAEAEKEYARTRQFWD